MTPRGWWRWQRGQGKMGEEWEPEEVDVGTKMKGGGAPGATFPSGVSYEKRQGLGGGFQPPRCDLPQCPRATHPGGTISMKVDTTGTVEESPRRPGAAAVARPTAVVGRKPPTSLMRAQPAGEGGGQIIQVGQTGRETVSQRGGRTGRPKGVRAPNTVGRVEGTTRDVTKNGYVCAVGGSGYLHGERRGPAGLYPCQGAPVAMRGI